LLPEQHDHLPPHESGPEQNPARPQLGTVIQNAL
jgi:hypothetical protein